MSDKLKKSENSENENTIVSSLKKINKSAKETTEYINGPSVNISYKKVPSLYDKMIGEDAMNDIRNIIYIIMFIICIFVMFVVLILSYMPAIYAFQTESISFYFKLILLFSAIISPYFIYPIIVMLMGPYQIYASYVALYYCGIPYMISSIFQYSKLNITGIPNLDVFFTEKNMGTFLGILFILGLIFQSGYQGYNWLKYLFPTILGNQKQTKKDEIVSESYYKNNKDKIFYN
jgi:hypothetical protein